MANDRFDSYGLKYSPIINRELEAVAVIEDGGAIRFTFLDGGYVTYETEADCCSSTWIEHLSVPLDLYEARILDITEPDLPPHPAADPVVDDHDNYEYIKVYHTAFATTKGHIVLEYRNSSNGYYGGSLRGPREGSK